MSIFRLREFSRKAMFRYFAFILSLLMCVTTHAQWYEVDGRAYVANGDKATARTLAIENALKKALLVAGASVSSIQQVVNGLVTQDELSVRASGTVNFVEVLSESMTGDQMTVTIRADIFPETKQCFASDYKKSLLLTKAHLTHREQANIGGLYRLDTTVINALNEHLKKSSRYVKTSLVSKNKTNFARLNNSFSTELIKELTTELGYLFDTQYVLYAEINDVSVNSDNLKGWKVWQDDSFDRHFSVHFYVYNAANGELVFDKQYQGQAPWRFDKRKQVDLNGQEFWHAEYGQLISRLLNDVVIDIDEAVMCKQTRGRIVQVQGNEIRINLGQEHGVQVGDEFTLLHANKFTSNRGKQYAGFNVSEHKVKVTQVSRFNAIAKTTNEKLLGNIQIDDLAVRD